MAETPPPPRWNDAARRWDEFRRAAKLLTRLPLGPVSDLPLAEASWSFALIGVVVGLLGGLGYALAAWIGLPKLAAALIALLVAALVSGGLHEDGLADTVDGFCGGADRDTKLAIMRDSRIGTYGVCALIIALLLRVGVLASFFSSVTAAWALLAAHAGARATMMAFMFLVPPARRDGLSSDAGQPPLESAAAAAILGFIFAAICVGFTRAVVALILLAAVVAVMAWLSRKQIGGQTGDVLGAVEQISEIAILLVALH